MSGCPSSGKGLLLSVVVAKSSDDSRHLSIMLDLVFHRREPFDNSFALVPFWLIFDLGDCAVDIVNSSSLCPLENDAPMDGILTTMTGQRSLADT